jgi:hypothetical protein
VFFRDLKLDLLVISPVPSASFDDRSVPELLECRSYEVSGVAQITSLQRFSSTLEGFSGLSPQIKPYKTPTILLLKASVSLPLIFLLLRTLQLNTKIIFLTMIGF